MTIQRIQLRRGTAAEWSTVNPVLAVAEVGVETNTRRFKIGDGLTPWNALGYSGESGEGGGAAAQTFETIAQNLTASPATFVYAGGNLVSVVYASGVIKTLTYSGGRLASVTLSGATPGGVSLTKTFTYIGDDLTGVSYA